MITTIMYCNTISKNETAIETLLKREVEQGNTPSVQYFLFDKDSVIYKFQIGYADIKNRKLVDESTTYNAYSVTKTFTALAIQQLAEKNLIDIDEPVKAYLPELPYSEHITIRQLLSHSSGIPNPIPLNWIHLTSEHKSFNSNDFFEEIIRRNSKVKLKPNEKFAYSNIGYVLLGQLIEKISGLSYEEYINIMIIKKINLEPHELGFIITNQDGHAKGYQKILSLTNIMLGLFVDKSKYMTKAEGNWKRLWRFDWNS
ncbi:serine hydrolase domain-containing protein [Pleomorphovibrio marinus]|uniref:serine hydrolase domain-containing protein n=1 Tax=Pleomorphovibrio marinus TaxID=2164132 RepID=UPI000E0A6F2B|nr:serine hydrolase domain-containing protein [Pleomorphovibrio marinus]